MTKYVVKMDYCTMAFTAGTCSLQALSNCLAGDTDLHWMHIQAIWIKSRMTRIVRIAKAKPMK